MDLFNFNGMIGFVHYLIGGEDRFRASPFRLNMLISGSSSSHFFGKWWWLNDDCLHMMIFVNMSKNDGKWLNTWWLN